MKQMRIVAFIMLVLTLMIPKAVQAQSKGEESIKAWLITDLHYLSPSLTDQGHRFDVFQRQAAGIDYQYGPERLAALLAQIETAEPNFLIVSGDLTTNGEYQSMVELAAFFEKVEKLETEVLVIPGNHDIHNGWAVGFEGKTTYPVQQTSPEAFAELFGPFGYHEASERDSNSLSYIASLSDKWNLLMLDSNIYSSAKGNGQSESKGQLKPETIEWMDQILADAESDNQFSLPILHHSGLSHFASMRGGNTLGNAEAFQTLLTKYQIPFMASGHLHIQHIAQAEVDGFTLHEMTTSSFAISPGMMGEIILDNDGVTYHQLPLDMATWFAENETGELTYETYIAHMDKLHHDSTGVIVFDALYNHKSLKEYTTPISEVFEALNLSFFKGHLYQDWPLLKDQLVEIEPLLKETDYRFFNGYLDMMLSTKDIPQTELKVKWLQ